MSGQTKARKRGRRLFDVVRGLGALVGVGVLAIGVPAGLIAGVGWPLPDEMPSVDEITSALGDTHVPDSFLIGALALICWFVWIELMASVMVEGVAYARGRQARRIPFTGGVQQAAARLVAGIALLGALWITKGTPDVAEQALGPLLPAGDPVSDTPALVVGEGGKPLKEEQPAQAQQEAPAPTYVVKPRDTLWGIAESELGDPFRWAEIFQINQGRPQPDGGVLHNADLIQPGWELELPRDARGAAVEPAAPAEEQPKEPAADGAAVEPLSAPSADDGMVLIDDDLLDGSDSAGGVILTASGSGTGGSSGEGGAESDGASAPDPSDGMVLLPNEDKSHTAREPER